MNALQSAMASKPNRSAVAGPVELYGMLLKARTGFLPFSTIYY